MLKAYINYPNHRITVHSAAECLAIQQQHKQKQRVLRLNVTTLSMEMNRFENKYYQFGSNHEINDMWCEIDLEDSILELAVIEDIKKLLADYYTSFKTVEVVKHC